jgi:hypothetical protein
MHHHKNYETNPRSAAWKREDAVSGVRFSAIKRHKCSLNLPPNEPKLSIWSDTCSDLWKR